VKSASRCLRTSIRASKEKQQLDKEFVDAWLLRGGSEGGEVFVSPDLKEFGFLKSSSGAICTDGRDRRLSR